MRQCGKRRSSDVDPFADSRLAGVDLLAAADEANDDGPVAVTVEARDEKLRLGLVEVGPLLLAAT